MNRTATSQIKIKRTGKIGIILDDLLAEANKALGEGNVRWINYDEFGLALA